MRGLTHLTGLLLIAVGQCTPLQQRATDAISSCGSTWMPSSDVSIAQGTDSRRGYDSAVKNFCSAVNGQTVRPDGYLSMATEVFLNGGKDPSTYGVLGFVHFEIHNKQSSDHKVASDSCVRYLQALSAASGKCSGTNNGDTKGGTWQVGNNAVSYHALAYEVPPQQDGLNKLFSGVLTPQKPNKGSGAPLNPWPFESLNTVKPTTCHSHNDYDRNIPIFSAMSAGCISLEADVFLSNGQATIGHDSPQSGRTLTAQYVQPLRNILDHNNGGQPGSNGVYKSRPEQSIVLMIDFKSADDALLDAVVQALEPLRSGGYLSSSASGRFVEKQVTVVATGKASFSRIDSGSGISGRDIFYDAKVDQWESKYTSRNSYYASADFKSTIGNPGSAQSFTQEQKNKVSAQVAPAHAAGLKVRYWNLPGEYMWEPLAALGDDRLNADDMYNTARLVRIS